MLAFIGSPAARKIYYVLTCIPTKSNGTEITVTLYLLTLNLIVGVERLGN